MKAYQELITEVYDKLDKKAGQDFFVDNCDYERLEEHNLWTYWQGRGVRHPKIMVVGQDWGSVEQSNKYFEFIKAHPDAKVVSYVQIKEANPKMKKREFTTDREMQQFFTDYLGYSDICIYPHDDLYFTNLIPGFRSGSSSTGNFNMFLEKELHEDTPRPIVLDLGNGNQVKMFALAHMGGLGKANRTKYYRDKQNKKTVKDDWKSVANYIKTNMQLSKEISAEYETGDS